MKKIAKVLLTPGVFIMAASIILFNNPAFAQEEDVCSFESGWAYGLCTSYSAMKCGTDDQQASFLACAKVLRMFFNITGEFPPCLNGFERRPDGICPCNADGEIPPCDP